MSVHRGRHFLQVPGPTNIPDRILRAVDLPAIDHRGPEFAELGKDVLAGAKRIFQTDADVFIFPASGTGGTEAALVNTLGRGDKVLMFETGYFSDLWKETAEKLGLSVEYLGSDWRRGVEAGRIEEALTADSAHEIKAVCIVYNETSTGTTSDLRAIRKAIDAAGHPALFMVDIVSALGSIPYSHDEWGIDVAAAGSQKGLMLPPGLGFNAVSAKARAARPAEPLGRSFWDWDAMASQNPDGFFPYTPATNLLYGLREAIAMLEEEGLEACFRRHHRLAEATRRAVTAWGLETVCSVPEQASDSVTAIFTPEGHSADKLRAIILDKFNMSLGGGLSKLADRAFRIGHMGDFNELMLMGALSGVEMGLKVAGVPHQSGGVRAAMDYLAETA